MFVISPHTILELILDNWLNLIFNFRAVLLVPDNFVRRHVKMLVDLLLNRLNFSCVIACQVRYKNLRTSKEVMFIEA